MTYCPRCGWSTRSRARFCGNCGLRVPMPGAAPAGPPGDSMWELIGKGAVWSAVMVTLMALGEMASQARIAGMFRDAESMSPASRVAQPRPDR